MMSDPEAKPEPSTRASEGRRVRWSAAWRAAAAEALGTALLVSLSGAGAAAGAGPAAAGAVVALLVQCFDHISGAMFNPTVLLAAALWGREPASRAALLLVAQLCGAVAGAAALGPAVAATVTRPARGVPALAAAALEAAGGACLALANCAHWDPRTAHLTDSWPLRIGTTVTALSLVASSLTGASFNPARSFGPALVAGAWDQHWLYWAAPLAGSLTATVLYCSLWRPAR